MSANNLNHKNALKYALDKAVNLIDTASNYQFGYSEKLIENHLKKMSAREISLLPNFYKESNKSRVVEIIKDFFYSIEPKFLETHIMTSLKKLKTDYLDGFLIHNPDIYEHILKSCSFLNTNICFM